MNSSTWRSIVALCLVLGGATVISPNLGMLAGIFVGLFLASSLWFVDHPAIWWYDLLFIAVLGVTALGASLIHVGTCVVMPMTGYVTRGCVTLDFRDAFLLNLWIVGIVGVAFWMIFRLWIWWKFRNS